MNIVDATLISRRAVFASLMILAGVLVCLSLTVPWRAFSQGSTIPINGYAWSDTAGWIDLNCANTNVCGTNNFAMSIDQNGNVSGYAWSEFFGWISANSTDLTGCPSGTCSASIAGGTMSGWMRAMSYSQSQSGGWDGFISLSGSGYGVSLASGNFSGYAWGDTNMGWVDFSHATTTYNTCVAAYSCSGQTIVSTANTCIQSNLATCTAPGYCSVGSSVCLYPQPTANASSTDPTITGHLQARPTIVAKGNTTKVYWNYSNVSSCTVTGTNGDSWNGTTNGGQVTGAIHGRTTYTLACTGLDSSRISENISVSILPSYQEI